RIRAWAPYRLQPKFRAFCAKRAFEHTSIRSFCAKCAESRRRRRPKPTPGDFADPDADPVLARSWREWPDWPEPDAARWRTSRLRYVMGGALRDDAPSDADLWIPAADLEAG